MIIASTFSFPNCKKLIIHNMVISLLFLSSLFSCNLKTEKRAINRSSYRIIQSVGDSLNGERVGEWIISTLGSKNDYDTSEIINYRNGKLHGISKRRGFDTYGRYVWEQINWKNGLEDGPSYQIDSKGIKLLMGYWKNGKAIGKHTKYYYQDFQSIQVREKKGILDVGASRTIELGNRIAYQFNYNNDGVLNGRFVSFQENGYLNGYGHYYNGKENGIWLENNGYVQRQEHIRLSIGKYRMGKKDGVW